MIIEPPRTPETEALQAAPATEGIPPADAVVFLVHGTFAGKPVRPDAPDDERPWWDEDGLWKRHLIEELRRQGYAGKVEPRAFQWPDPKKGDGPNFESERRRSGELLLDHLLDFEKKDGRPYHLIGHSHGGSVVWHALVASIRRAREDKGARLGQLRSWITVGTPFIEFRGNPQDRRGPWLAVLAALACFLMMIFFFWPNLPSLFSWDDVAQLWWHPPVASPIRSEAFLDWDYHKHQSLLLLPQGLFYALVFFCLWRSFHKLISKMLDARELRVSRGRMLRWLVSGALALGATLILRTGLTGAPDTCCSITPQRAWLVLSVAALFASVCVLVLLVRKIWRLRALERAANRRQLYETIASEDFGDRWLGFSHPDDEAIALMGAAMRETPRLRPPQRQEDGAGQPFRVIDWLDDVVRPLFDEATWRTLVQFALGDDQAGLYAWRVGRAPSALVDRMRMIETAHAKAMSESANRQAEKLVDSLRSKLRHTMALRDEAEFLSLLNDISFSGVLHCSYLTPDDAPGREGHSILTSLARWMIARGGAGRSVDPGGLPPLVRPADREDQEILAASGRFARLEFATIMFWGLAGLAVSALPLSMIWANVLPHTQSTQIERTRQAARLEPQLLNMQDAPLAGAYAVYLAAAGELETPKAIGAIMTGITNANARAVIAQRLAFAFGVAQKPELAAAVLKFTSPRDLPKDDSPHRVRANLAAQLSLLYAKVATGQDISDAGVDQIKAAMERARRDRPPVNCSDTDLPGMLALYVPVLLAIGSPVEEVRKVLLDAARKIQARCLPEEQKNLFDADGWIALRIVEIARDLASWGRQDDLVPKVLRLAFRNPDEEKTSGAIPPDRTPITVLHDALTRQERRGAQYCLQSIARIGHVLRGDKKKKRDKKKDRWGTDDAYCTQFKDEIINRSAAGCYRNHVGKATLWTTDNKKKPNPCGNISNLIHRFNTRGEVSFVGLEAHCRANPLIVSGSYRAMVQQARSACEGVGEASGAALALAGVLAGMKAPPGDAAMLFKSVSKDDTVFGNLQLFQLPEAVRHLGKALPPSAPRLAGLGTIRQPMEQMIEALEALIGEQARESAVLRERMKYDVANDRLETLHTLRVRLLAHVAPLEAEAALRKRFERRRAHPVNPVTLSQAKAMAEAIREVAGLPENEVLRHAPAKNAPPLDRALAARMLEVAMGISPEDPDKVLPKIFRPRTEDEDISRFRDIIRLRLDMQAKLGLAMGGLRPTLDVILRQEEGDTKEEYRLAVAPLKARAHLAAGHYAAALRAARETARRDQVASIHCAILEDLPRRRKGIQETYRLQDGLRWPKPVPTLFDTGPTMTFDKLERGLPRCTLFSPSDNE